MLKILHLSWEIPDTFNSKKTKAVVNLIKETKGKIDSSIISINRSNNILFRSIPDSTANQISIRYFGFPLGLFHVSCLKNLYARIHCNFKNYDLIHGHKLTFEGVLCYLAYRKMGKRYVLTLRGNTDFKLIKYLPYCRRIFRKVAEHSEKIFCLNQWSAEKLRKLYPKTSDKIVILPNICYLERFLDNPNCLQKTENRNLFLATTFNLDSYKLKRFELTLRILKRLSLPASLLVIGAGHPRAEEAVKKLIVQYSVQDKVELLGYKNHEEMISIYQKCDMFLLPSRSESFGMAYLEALSCGLPVLQTEGVGLDGYFENEPFFKTARSEDDFIAAIEEFYPKKNEVKNYLLEFLKNGHFEKFSVKNIVKTYVSEICSVPAE